MDTSQETKNPETASPAIPVEETGSVTPAETVGENDTKTSTQVEVQEPFYKKHVTALSIVFGVIIVLTAGGYVYVKNYVHDGIIATIGGKKIYLYPNGGVVATVNGEKIYQKDLNENATLIEQSAKLQGADITDESVKKEIKAQALNVLVDNMLILTAASKNGITVTDEEVQSKFDDLITQVGSKEELEKQMADIGLTEEKLKDNLRERIVADKYIETQTDIKSISVSDEEIAEYIKSINTGGTQLPPLEELRPKVKEEILKQKQQQLIATLLKKLRSEATIETKA